VLRAIGDAGDGPGGAAVPTGDGMKDRIGVGVGVAVGVKVGGGVDVGRGVDVDAGVGVGDRVGDGDSAVNGVSVGLGDRDGVGVGEGRSTIGSSVGCASAAGVDCVLGLGAGVVVDPGSDQSPALSPLTKVVCNLV
jgi:hypothetical protein